MAPLLLLLTLVELYVAMGTGIDAANW